MCQENEEVSRVTIFLLSNADMLLGSAASMSIICPEASTVRPYFSLKEAVSTRYIVAANSIKISVDDRGCLSCSHASSTLLVASTAQ